MRCLIVDDEPLARAILTDYVSKMPFLTLTKATSSAIEALTLVQQGAADLVFLDIQMPELTGMQFLKLSGGRCPVILTTAYSEYALEGYEHNVVDYLLKPIAFERFYKAVLKASANRSDLNSTGAYPVPTVVVPQPDAQPIAAPIAMSTPDFLFVKTEYRLQRVDLADILYVEGLKDYVSLFTPTDRILALQTMKFMDEKLPADRFVRVHKSYIVALNQIESIERGRIYVNRPGRDKAVIPIGDTYRDGFYDRIGG
jgi:two-component system, LytTR family, response regulator